VAQASYSPMGLVSPIFVPSQGSTKNLTQVPALIVTPHAYHVMGLLRTVPAAMPDGVLTS
jgi:hypothetical protein